MYTLLRTIYMALSTFKYIFPNVVIRTLGVSQTTRLAENNNLDKGSGTEV
jgi:hypothetical protein